jgi:hypothetical protein
MSATPNPPGSSSSSSSDANTFTWEDLGNFAVLIDQGFKAGLFDAATSEYFHGVWKTLNDGVKDKTADPDTLLDAKASSNIHTTMQRLAKAGLFDLQIYAVIGTLYQKLTKKVVRNMA